MKRQINLAVDAQVWQDYKVYCIKNNVYASSEIEKFMKKEVSK